MGFAVYSRYASTGAGLDVEATPPVSYVAHLTGALAGLTIGNLLGMILEVLKFEFDCFNYFHYIFKML